MSDDIKTQFIGAVRTGLSVGDELADLRRQLDAEKAKVKRLREASRKLRLCFPDVMPNGELQAEFTIPRYIIEELAAALAETETTT